MLIVWIVLDIAVAVILWLAFWWLVTFFVEKSTRQKQFVAGIVPQTPPAGFYDGAAYPLGNRRVPWLGKSFESENAKGFNIFTPKGAAILKVLTPLYRLFRVSPDGNTDAYYFKTSVGPGFKDKDIDVFKLDYDSAENPFLIRIILDEMVELAPQKFLGKVHLKVFPGYYSTIGFFGLSRDLSDTKTSN